jgi:ketosteroid isomerase-like protein
MSAANVELARKGYEAITHGDLDAVRDLFDPDVKWHGGDPTAEGACQNRDQALKFIRAGIALGRMAQLVDVVDAGDRVVVIVKPPKGPLRANVTTFRDGKVVEMVAHESPEAAMTAAGLPSS